MIIDSDGYSCLQSLLRSMKSSGAFVHRLSDSEDSAWGANMGFLESGSLKVISGRLDMALVVFGRI